MKPLIANKIVTDPNGYKWAIDFVALDVYGRLYNPQIVYYSCLNPDLKVSDPTAEMLSHLVDFKTLDWSMV